MMCFVAPKVIGGERAPSPVGDGLNLLKMSDALDVTDVVYEQVDRDVLATGFLPVSTSIFHVASEAYSKAEPAQEVECGEEEGGEVNFYKAWS